MQLRSSLLALGAAVVMSLAAGAALGQMGSSGGGAGGSTGSTTGSAGGNTFGSGGGNTFGSTGGNTTGNTQIAPGQGRVGTVPNPPPAIGQPQGPPGFAADRGGLDMNARMREAERSGAPCPDGRLPRLQSDGLRTCR